MGRIFQINQTIRQTSSTMQLVTSSVVTTVVLIMAISHAMVTAAPTPSPLSAGLVKSIFDYVHRLARGIQANQDDLKDMKDFKNDMKWTFTRLKTGLDEEGFKLQFVVHSEKKKWQEAQSVCQAEGGNLASPDDDSIHHWLGKQFTNLGRIWIGATDEANHGSWTWTNGNPVNKTNWAPDEPNGAHEHCAHIKNSSGEWNDQSCNPQISFVCQRF